MGPSTAHHQGKPLDSLNVLKDYDMDAEMLGEAKDFVSGWIDKAGADGDGIDYQVSLRWQLSFF